MAQITDERLVKILSETQATIMEHNSRCVRGSVEVDARLFESMIMELQVRRKAAEGYKNLNEMEQRAEQAECLIMCLDDLGVPDTEGRESLSLWGRVKIFAEENSKDRAELQERRKADSEPVAYIFKHPAGRLFWSLTDESNKGHDDVMPVYAAPQPAPERDQVRIAHAEWSQATFGNVGPVGPLKHLSKEALEAATEPGDLSEWADMQFLLWDAQRRAGITDEQITQAMIDKLAVNKQREWPEPKDGEPRLHIKEQPAPVAPAVSDDIGEIRVGRLPTMNQDDYPGLGDWWVQLRIGEDSDEVLARVYGATPQEANNRAEALACRAAMLHAGNSPAQSDCCPAQNSVVPAQSGNSPAIPDGYVLVPKEATKQMILAGQEELESCIDNGFDSDVDGNRYDYTDIVPDAPHRVFMAMLAAAPQEVIGE